MRIQTVMMGQEKKLHRDVTENMQGLCERERERDISDYTRQRIEMLDMYLLSPFGGKKKISRALLILSERE